MAKLSLSASELNRALYNVLLFCREKTFFGSLVKVAITYEDLRFLTSDDHIILAEKIDDVTFIDGSRGSTYQYFDRTTIREMVKELAALDEDYQVPLPDFTKNWDEVVPEHEEVLTAAMDVLKEGLSPEVLRASGPWALNRDRLRNLGLLKTPGDMTYPIDLLFTTSAVLDGRPVVHFKVGPTLRGAIAPLLRGGLPEHVVRDGLLG